MNKNKKLSKPKSVDVLAPPLPDVSDKITRTSFQRKLPDGRTVDVRATKVKRALQ